MKRKSKHHNAIANTVDLAMVRGRLELLCKARGWSQRVLEKRAGLANGTLSKTWHGTFNPNAATFRAVATVLGIELAELVRGTDLPAAAEPPLAPEHASLEQRADALRRTVVELADRVAATCDQVRELAREVGAATGARRNAEAREQALRSKVDGLLRAARALEKEGPCES